MSARIFSLNTSERKGWSKEGSLESFKILVASDNHIGFKENDSLRGEDSFDAFEEVLKIAKEEKVDFLLLSGNVFHESNPSQKCMNKMFDMLRKYVFGSDEICFEMPNYEANFQDSNFNIELPIFTIHGNHDYPQDECGNLSVLDLFHTPKYINYFGKVNSEKITVSPIIFSKGSTVIALYGIGYIKDKYFHKQLEDDNVMFVKPSELGYDKCVSILVIHQSKFKGLKSGQNYKHFVHPEQFPNWFDLIIRGHENEQVDEVGKLRGCPIRVVQPGSTIPTNLVPQESTPRRAILFEVKGQDASFQDIILVTSYRPVLIDNVEMRSLLRQAGIDISKNPPTEEETEKILWDHVQSSIKTFKEVLEERFPNRQLLQKKPQMRFKIEHSGIENLNPQKYERFEHILLELIMQYNLRMENKLGEFVSNPGEIFKLWKRVIVNSNQIRNQKNSKLDENFIKTLKQKEDFDTIGNDAVKDIIDLYEQRIALSGRVHCLPTSLIMSSLENVNQRNRNSQIEDIIRSVQQKLEANVMKSEEEQVRNINKLYRKQMNGIMQSISGKIEGGLNSQSNSQNQKIIYRNIMNNQFDDLKSSLTFKIREKVAELYVQFAPESEVNRQMVEEQQLLQNTQMSKIPSGIQQILSSKPSNSKGSSLNIIREGERNNSETEKKSITRIKINQTSQEEVDPTVQKTTYDQLFGRIKDSQDNIEVEDENNNFRKLNKHQNLQEENEDGIDLENIQSQDSECEFKLGEKHQRQLQPTSYYSQFKKDTEIFSTKQTQLPAPPAQPSPFGLKSNSRQQSQKSPQTAFGSLKIGSIGSSLNSQLISQQQQSNNIEGTRQQQQLCQSDKLSQFSSLIMKQSAQLHSLPSKQFQQAVQQKQNSLFSQKSISLHNNISSIGSSKNISSNNNSHNNNATIEQIKTQSSIESDEDELPDKSPPKQEKKIFPSWPKQNLKPLLNSSAYKIPGISSSLPFQPLNKKPPILFERNDKDQEVKDTLKKFGKIQYKK